MVWSALLMALEDDVFCRWSSSQLQHLDDLSKIKMVKASTRRLVRRTVPRGGLMFFNFNLRAKASRLGLFRLTQISQP